jgi:DNA-binding NarL/FixJ family response regulator
MPGPITIMLVDDHELLLESWKLLLENDDRFKVIAECNNGVDAIEQAQNLLPDIILMDMNMSPVNGFEATKTIMERNPLQKIIGVSANNYPRYATKFLSLGAKGFVTKTSAFNELKTAILKVNSGEIFICEEIRNKTPGYE